MAHVALPESDLPSDSVPALHSSARSLQKVRRLRYMTFAATNLIALVVTIDKIRSAQSAATDFP